ncbi:hypothetical protein WA158_004705 [Blastocystis sp. Blastoise]
MYSHAKTKKHIIKKSIMSSTSSDNTKANNIGNEFEEDLCRTMVASNRLLISVDDEPMKQFVTKYTGRTTPCYRTLKDTYLPIIYGKDKAKVIHIMESVHDNSTSPSSCDEMIIRGDNEVQIFVDSTTDICGREVVAILGKIVSNNKGQYNDQQQENPIFLLDIINDSNISSYKYASIIYDTLKEYKIKDTNVKYFSSDNASVMYKTAETISIFYRNIIHIPCICHILNLICMAIQDNLENSDNLIRGMNNYFNFSIHKKNSLKDYLLKNGLSNVSTFPQFVETRWSSFFKSLLFHCKYIDYYYDYFQPIFDNEKSNKQLKIIKNIINNPTKYQETRMELFLLKGISEQFVNIITTLSSDSYPIINMYSLAEVISNNIQNIIDNIDSNIKENTNTNISISFDNLKNNILQGMLNAQKLYKKYLGEQTHLYMIYKNYHCFDYLHYTPPNSPCSNDLNLNPLFTNISEKEIELYIKYLKEYQSNNNICSNLQCISLFLTKENIQGFAKNMPKNIKNIQNIILSSLNIVVSNTPAERLFSKYNDILIPRRSSLQFENIRYYIFEYFNFSNIYPSIGKKVETNLYNEDSWLFENDAPI